MSFWITRLVCKLWIRVDFQLTKAALRLPLRTVEEWEAGRRKPPEYIPRLKKYQIMYEQQFGKQNKKEHDDTV